MSIQQHTETYWTNRFGGRFDSEQLAKEDEERRSILAWKIAKIIGSAESVWPQTVRPNQIVAIDDTKIPYTGQSTGTAYVWLFKDLVECYQKLLEQHGPYSGYTTHYLGMDRCTDEIVVVQPNPDHKIS